MKTMMNVLNLVCAILLFIAVFKLPSTFYHMLRILVFYGAFLTFISIRRKNQIWSIAFLSIAVLFNPFLPIYMGQKIFWIPVDIISALLFLLTFYLKKAPEDEEKLEVQENKFKSIYSRDRISK